MLDAQAWVLQFLLHTLQDVVDVVLQKPTCLPNAQQELPSTGDERKTHVRTIQLNLVTVIVRQEALSHDVIELRHIFVQCDCNTLVVHDTGPRKKTVVGGVV